jgi:glycine cleavage system H protein
MDPGTAKTLAYKRSHFATQLPVDYLYAPSHAWIASQGQGVWRVGLTKFATRMLGEIVDYGFEAGDRAAVQLGQIVGWVEGFKAISDLFCIASGQFRGGNPELRGNVKAIGKDPYGAGWLYLVEGTPDPNCVDVEAYRGILDKTIDRLMEKQKAEDEDEGRGRAGNDANEE